MAINNAITNTSTQTTYIVISDYLAAIEASRTPDGAGVRAWVGAGSLSSTESC